MCILHFMKFLYVLPVARLKVLATVLAGIASQEGERI